MQFTQTPPTIKQKNHKYHALVRNRQILSNDFGHKHHNQIPWFSIITTFILKSNVHQIKLPNSFQSLLWSMTIGLASFHHHFQIQYPLKPPGFTGSPSCHERRRSNSKKIAKIEWSMIRMTKNKLLTKSDKNNDQKSNKDTQTTTRTAWTPPKTTMRPKSAEFILLLLLLLT